jgi:uncharacterized protein (DUF1501 family)
VLIELLGGLDGLSVLVPRDDDVYRRNRPTLALPSASLLRFDEERGFPPHLIGLHELWHAGRMRIVDGAGYPHSTMSHFAGRVVWGAGFPNHSPVSSGWLARLRQHLWSDDSRPELLTHLGDDLAPALRAPNLPVLCFERPTDLEWIAPCGRGEAAGPRPDTRREAEAAQTPGILSSLRETLSISRRLGPILRSIDTGYSPRVEYPATDLGRRLRTIASLIDAGFGSRVYSVQHGGFDMHSGDHAQTVQAPQQFAEAVLAFLKDLEGTSAFEDTLVLCHSEFGRRPKENSAGGCDHGAAGMMFLFGGSMRGGLTGRRPSLTELDANENLIPTMDFRRVYAAVIEQWFQADHEPVLLERLDVPELI